MLTQEQVTQVPIGKVKPAPDNPRQKVGDVAELAMSIKSVGIRSPILARQVGDHFEVVAGARRLAAATLAGLDTVPIIVQELDEHERLLVMAIENLQREDLSPLEEARAYQRLLDALGVSQRELAPKVGKTQSHISKRLALLVLPEDVQTKVDAGGITIADAVELAKLADHPKRLAKALKDEPWNPLNVRVRNELAELERDRKIEKRQEELESKGIATVRAHSRWNMPKNIHRLKESNGVYDPQALQISVKEHVKHACHAVAITKDGTEIFVCTDRKQHPKVKTVQEERQASSESGSAFTAPREDPLRKKLREARDGRLAFLRPLVAKKPPKGAVEFIMLATIEREIEYGEIDWDGLVVMLGLATLPEPTDDDPKPELDPSIDPVALLRDFAASGEAQLHRAALAVAALQVDCVHGDVDGWLSSSGLWGAGSAKAYLEFLQAQGHKLADIEKKRLDEEQPATAAVAA